MEETDPRKSYTGLLGLDNSPKSIKIIIFMIAVILGAIMVSVSTIRPVSFPTIRLEYWPLSWPLLFVYGFPACLVILVLRLAGLKWRWGVFAAFLGLALPLLLFSIFYIVARIFIVT